MASNLHVVGIIPKSAFYPLFESLLDGKGGKVRVFKPEPAEGEERPPLEGDEGGGAILSWWRRGREPVSECPR